MFSLGMSIQSYPLEDDYIQVPGLIDLRTDFSDGAHSLEYLIELAKKRGFQVLFINDHDRKVLEYGIRPFQNILKKKVEEPSINKGGPDKYLGMIKSASKRYPQMILIPGAESAPFYYWKGSYFQGNLTVCDWERHLVIVGLEKPRDYKELPILHNGFSTEYIIPSIPAAYFFLLIPLLLSFYMIKGKRFIRYSGIFLLILTLILLINSHPFKSSPFNQYQGNQGVSPYQVLIDYVNSRGGLVFWNHPETQSGRGRLGPVFKETPPYPQVLLESTNYTGFAALYGEGITVTEPGNIWDQVLLEYCSGQRAKPVWGISTADFHREGAARARLGRYPTIFLVKDRIKKDILNALKKGRIYAYAGNVDLSRLVLEEFSVSDSEASQKGIMGEEIYLNGFPIISILLSSTGSEKGNPQNIRLIRSGKLIQTFTGETPLSIYFQDEFFDPGRKIYYRLDVRDKMGRKLVSNPIFVRFKSPDQGKSK
ncbi:hypothetical protein AMJ44_03765 [candidate division WOR-1 bacterium DG_54_3]|uniref:Polymerase/histidinol phosphatase N-terminal domain-containing protein n=1 Tax=candidate division WOR-1 bacterium DG_54_3 TaxID=1703775 RepID=A0A0S7Y415_UNCSA|nr:MAG: hypothetical protein AMJ44_03765 [candidate division WOR-1 bacterium DG_54_3]